MPRLPMDMAATVEAVTTRLAEAVGTPSWVEAADTPLWLELEAAADTSSTMVPRIPGCQHCSEALVTITVQLPPVARQMAAAF